MYISTAFLTGLVVALMVFWTPANQGWARWGVVGGALLLILLTLPSRKGMALALELWLKRHVEESWE